MKSSILETMETKRRQFDRRVEALRRRADEVRASLPAGQSQLAGVEDLQQSLEELHVASEELHSQAEDLIEARTGLEAERRRYLDLFDFAPDGYLVTDPAGIIREANRAAAAMLGADWRHLSGKALAVLVSRDERGAFRTRLNDLARLEPVRDWDLTLLRRNSPFPASLTVAGVRDAEGQLVALRWMLRDITERAHHLREMEAARSRIEDLARAQERRADWLAAILDQMPAGVVIFSADQQILSTNRAVAEILGIPMASFSLTDYGKTWHCLAPDGTPLAARDLPPLRALKGQVVTGHEEVLVRPDGRRVPLMCSATPLSENGRITAAVAVFWDISAQKEVQRQLEEAGRLKDEFLSMASHELKTPVTSIQLLSELVMRHPDRVKPQHMETVLRQANQLTSLINDLLDVSRLELGRMPVEMRPLDLAALVRDSCERHTSLCADHPTACLIDSLPVQVNGDPVRLEQVFCNLFDNAHKYTPKGRRIRVGLTQRDGKALLQVDDEGLGIAPEHLPHIFERFYKPGPRQAVYSGLGVGLYITREIVKNHGGRIWAESEPDKGSTFFVELPLAPGQPDP
ncbi:MAG: ATP-binding protein [Pseudomonadota bacterium]